MTLEQLNESMDQIEFMQWSALFEVEADEYQRAMKRAQGK